ncbi:hypothetical protein LUZ60_016091 [Juncus effusus]|nr:hypothetical protein LUZ60_016091 [Juncus effusus]
MSIILTTSPPKDCSKRGHSHYFHHLRSNKKLLISLSTLTLSLLSISLLLWLMLHPNNPEFYLKDLSLLNSTVQTTFVSKNPNSHASIYYDSLRTYLAYAGVQVSADVVLPPFYQGTVDSDIITADIMAPTGLKVGPSTDTRETSLSVRIVGRLRWKVGPWISGEYDLRVSCMAVLMGQPGTPRPISSVQGAQCSTSV